MLEEILMVPVCTGKTMAGFIDRIRKDFFSKAEILLLVHCGGSPALYVFMKEVLDRQRLRIAVY